jgi:hypothetical protein
MRLKSFTPLYLILVGLTAYVVFFRKRWLNWGMQKKPLYNLPGDSLIPFPNYQSMRSVVIPASPKQIWPWIIQLGYERGGFYSYDSLERIAGLSGLISASQIVPTFQDIKLGDSVLISPVTPMEVAVLEPERAFVLHTKMNPFTAIVYDKALEPEGPSLNWSWAFILEPAGPEETRLIARVRGISSPSL